jgi:rod shape-determining protein MreC
MYFLYRWWDRYRVVLALTLVSVGAAWSIRLTQGASLLELYRWIALPFQPDVAQQEQLINARTWELQQRLAELETQNQNLRQLLDEPVLKQGRAIAAPIIGRSADHWWQQITLGRGRQEGLKIGSIVVAPGGLVGRITSMSSHTSRVLLVTDPTSHIGVILSRSRQMGILRGQAGKQAVIDFFEKDPDVRPGDVAITSSLSSLFPASLPVGRVKSLVLNQTSSPKAVIELSAPISNLEWVTVYLNDQASKTLVSPNP